MFFSLKPTEKKEEEDNELAAGFDDEEDVPEKHPVLSIRDTVNAQLKKQNAAYEHRATEETAKLLLENPEIFQFDSEKKTVSNISSKEQSRESKYMKNIIKEHKRRELDQSVRWERMEAKERQREQEKNGEKEEQRFYTSSYRKFQQQKTQFEQIEEAEERYNEQHSAANAANGMMGFYSKLLNGNAAVSCGRRSEATGESHEKALEKIEKKFTELQDRKRSRSREKVDSKFMSSNMAINATKKSDNTLEPKVEEKSPQSLPNSESPKLLSKEDKISALKNRYLARKSAQSNS